MNKNLVYKITITKAIVSGNLEGFEVTDSYNVDGAELGAEIDRLNGLMGKVRKLLMTSCHYKIISYKYEEVR